MSVNSLSCVATMHKAFLEFIYFKISAEEAILSIGFVPLNISSIAQNTGIGAYVAFIILRRDSASAM